LWHNVNKSMRWAIKQQIVFPAPWQKVYNCRKLG
jgi:hypothetical protein